MTTVRDCNGKELWVGALVTFGVDPECGVVTAISDPDGDVDDYGRAVQIPPCVTVLFTDGSEERAGAVYDGPPITWAMYPDGPPDEWMAEDLELLLGQQRPAHAAP